MVSPVRRVLRFLIFKLLPYDYKKHTKVKSVVNDESLKVVVSLTSFPARISNLWLVINCLLHQTSQPDLIILWLSLKQFEGLDDVPDSLKKLQSDKFQIRFVDEDYRSHKKYLYVFNEYPNDYVILVDDDIIYRPDLLENLIMYARLYPDSVICNYGSIIDYYDDGRLKPYNSWKKIKRLEPNYHHFFFGSGGGTLFRPCKLYKDVLNIKLALKLTPLADDIWLNCMVRLSGLKIFYLNLGEFVPIKEEGYALFDENLSKNDIQLNAIIEYYQSEININPFNQ
ncbi:glycosyltransferase [Macellibacteroides fermentans]|nr:glycosyltransferase [Parabacteroides chartae]